MTQRIAHRATAKQILYSAMSLTILSGVFFFVSFSNVEAFHQPSPSPSISPSPSVSPSPSASPSTSPSPSVSPTPNTSGKPIMLYQSSWRSGSTATTTLESRVINPPSSASTVWQRLFSSAFPGSGNFRYATWDKIAVSRNVTVTSSHVAGVTTTEAAMPNNYFISTAFESQAGSGTKWGEFGFTYQNANVSLIQVYYRVADTQTTDPKDGNWVPISLGTRATTPRTIKTKIDQTGKYFQIKVHLGGPRAQFSHFGVIASPVEPSPSPTVSPSVSPTPTPSVVPSVSPTNRGKITIVTKKVIAGLAPSPTPTATQSGPPLPDDIVSPSPTPLPTSTIDPNCFDRHDTDPAPSVRVNVRQTVGGNTSAEDQITDDDGIWHGLGGSVDEFPVGTYSVSFGDFERDDYKLVAFCVTPDDGQHYLKTQTNPATKRAVIMVQANQETRITALYMPRNKPYIAMSKFAISSRNNKILKSIIPGTAMRYLIRYENTGDADAKDVVISDVIPEQFYVPDSEQETLDREPSFRTNIDARGRTIISKVIGTLKRGEKGSMMIPVVLRPDAFGTPEDIVDFLRGQTSESTSSSSGGSTASSPSSSPTVATSPSISPSILDLFGTQ